MRAIQNDTVRNSTFSPTQIIYLSIYISSSLDENKDMMLYQLTINKNDDRLIIPYFLDICIYLNVY
jgi:hypothetical protein